MVPLDTLKNYTLENLCSLETPWENLCSLELRISKLSALLQQTIHERSLSMVHMGDDHNISEVVTTHSWVSNAENSAESLMGLAVRTNSGQRILPSKSIFW